jgi:hypothetical protein
MRFSTRYLALASLCAALYCGPLAAAEPMWLSEKSPHAGHGGGHNHGGTVSVRRGVYYKQLWLRHGAVPAEAGFVNQVTALSKVELLDTAGKLKEIPFARDEGHGLYNVEFPMPNEGFYNAYATHQWINGSVREVQIAKAEVLKHSFREGHDNVQEKMPPKFNANIPLEIVRQRLPKENFHTLLSYGNSATFTVLSHGKPLPGAEVTLTSGQGWSRRVVSNSVGQVTYTMIRDYFPPWKMFQKRHSEPYLISTSYAIPEKGKLKGKAYESTVYRASFSANYYPSPNDYESYAYGLSFGTAAMVLSVGGIVLYRRRRNRPYKEVRFDD